MGSPQRRSDSPDLGMIKALDYLVVGIVNWGRPKPKKCIQMTRVHFNFKGRAGGQESGGKLIGMDLDTYSDKPEKGQIQNQSLLDQVLDKEKGK